MWGLYWAEVSIEPIEAFLYYRLRGRKMPGIEYCVALIRTCHTQETKQRILRCFDREYEVLLPVHHEGWRFYSWSEVERLDLGRQFLERKTATDQH